MIRHFRKRFIQLNMILVGVVLLAAFVFAAIGIYRNDYAELKKPCPL